MKVYWLILWAIAFISCLGIGMVFLEPWPRFLTFLGLYVVYVIGHFTLIKNMR